MLVRCPHCSGEGIDPGEYKQETCEACTGVGILDEVKCDVCGGQGCPRCHNQGVLQNVECPHCETQGIVYLPVRCPKCRGLKTVVDPKIFQ